MTSDNPGVADEAAISRQPLLAVHGDAAPAEPAAFANAAFTHGFEMDDTEMATTSHPGNVVVPVVLALAQEARASGAAMLTAMRRVAVGAHGRSDSPRVRHLREPGGGDLGIRGLRWHRGATARSEQPPLVRGLSCRSYSC